MGIFKDNYGDFHEVWCILATIIGIVLAIIVMLLLIFAVIYPIEQHTCQQTALKMGVEWDYGLWIGCMYKINGRWVDEDNYEEIRGRLE